MTEATAAPCGAEPPPPPSADALRERGNAEFAAGAFLAAAATYTRALKVEPASEVLHSNRAAALLRLGRATKALADAEAAVRLAPGWEKGHIRRGAALEALGRLDDALEAYATAAACAPGNAQVGAKVRELRKTAGRAASVCGGGRPQK